MLFWGTSGAMSNAPSTLWNIEKHKDFSSDAPSIADFILLWKMMLVAVFGSDRSLELGFGLENFESKAQNWHQTSSRVFRAEFRDWAWNRSVRA